MWLWLVGGGMAVAALLASSKAPARAAAPAPAPSSGQIPITFANALAAQKIALKTEKSSHDLTEFGTALMALGPSYGALAPPLFLQAANVMAPKSPSASTVLAPLMSSQLAPWVKHYTGKSGTSHADVKAAFLRAMHDTSLTNMSEFQAILAGAGYLPWAAQLQAHLEKLAKEGHHA